MKLKKEGRKTKKKSKNKETNPEKLYRKKINVPPINHHPSRGAPSTGGRKRENGRERTNKKKKREKQTNEKKKKNRPTELRSMRVVAQGPLRRGYGTVGMRSNGGPSRVVVRVVDRRCRGWTEIGCPAWYLGRGGGRWWKWWGYRQVSSGGTRCGGRQ